jgi:hypothetical protein
MVEVWDEERNKLLFVYQGPTDVTTLWKVAMQKTGTSAVDSALAHWDKDEYVSITFSFRGPSKVRLVKRSVEREIRVYVENDPAKLYRAFFAPQARSSEELLRHMGFEEGGFYLSADKENALEHVQPGYPVFLMEIETPKTKMFYACIGYMIGTILTVIAHHV